MKKKRPLRSVFLLAAEKQFFASVDLSSQINDDYVYKTSPFSCTNIKFAQRALNIHDREARGETEFYEKYFADWQPSCMDPSVLVHSFVWWPRLEGQSAMGDHDHESRIYALLFAAEMLRR